MALTQQMSNLAVGSTAHPCPQVQAFAPQQPDPKMRRVLEKLCRKQAVPSCCLLLSGVQEQWRCWLVPRLGLHETEGVLGSRGHDEMGLLLLKSVLR